MNLNSVNKARIPASGQRSFSQPGSGVGIRIISAAGGFLSALAFLGFLVITGLYDSAILMLVLGIVMTGLSILLSRIYDRPVIDTVCVYSFILGLILWSAGLILFQLNDQLLCVVLILISLFTIFAVERYILLSIALLVIHGSLFALFLINMQYALIPAYMGALIVFTTWIFYKEAMFRTHSRKISLVYTSTRGILPYVLLSTMLFTGTTYWRIAIPDTLWISSVAVFICLFYVLYTILKLFETKNRTFRILIYITCLLVLLPTAVYPAIPAAILIMLISFRVNHLSGFIAGIIGLIFFISQYYYDLQYSLLIKSALLTGSGLFFLILYLLLSKKIFHE